MVLRNHGFVCLVFPFTIAVLEMYLGKQSKPWPEVHIRREIFTDKTNTYLNSFVNKELPQITITHRLFSFYDFYFLCSNVYIGFLYYLQNLGGKPSIVFIYVF